MKKSLQKILLQSHLLQERFFQNYTNPVVDHAFYCLPGTIINNQCASPGSLYVTLIVCHTKAEKSIWRVSPLILLPLN